MRSVHVALGLLPALALACLLVGNWKTEMLRGGAVEKLELLPGTTLVDVEPDEHMRIVGEIVGAGYVDGFTPWRQQASLQQSLIGTNGKEKPSGKQNSCYSKVCKQCWNQCSEVMNMCLDDRNNGVGPPRRKADPTGSCTRVWDSASDCSKSIKYFEISGVAANNGFRDAKYHFMLAAWSQCAHGGVKNKNTKPQATKPLCSSASARPRSNLARARPL